MIGNLVLSLLLASSISLLPLEARAAKMAGAPSPKRFNIRVNPLGIIGGFYNAAFDVGVMEELTVGPSYSRISIKFAENTITGQGFGVRANSFLYGPRLAGGWYFGPSLMFYQINAERIRSGQTGTFATRVTAAEGIVGHQWIWENFNVNLGGGLSYLNLQEPIVFVYPGGQKESFEEFKSGTFLSFELGLGWAF